MYICVCMCGLCVCACLVSYLMFHHPYMKTRKNSFWEFFSVSRKKWTKATINNYPYHWHNGKQSGSLFPRNCHLLLLLLLFFVDFHHIYAFYLIIIFFQCFSSIIHFVNYQQQQQQPSSHHHYRCRFFLFQNIRRSTQVIIQLGKFLFSSSICT